MSDLLRKYKSLYSSTCNTFSTGEGVTITPASVTGLPTDTEITLTFDRVDSSGTKTPSKMERIRGTVTGGNFVISSGGRAVEGTEQVHTSPVVEMIWNADDWNDAVDHILTEHNQDGTHKDTLITSLGYNSMARQAIINGNFDVWQRGTTITNSADNTFLADRWRIRVSADGGTLPTSIVTSRQILTSGDIYNSFYYYRIAPNGAGSSLGVNSFNFLDYRIENGTRFLCGDGKKITISFYARASVAGKKLGVYVEQNYGDGGSVSSPEKLLGTTFSLTSSWVKYTLTLTTNTLAGKTFGTNNNDFLNPMFWIQWGSNLGTSRFGVASEGYGGDGTIDIAQVQLCAGDVALPFMPKSYEEELRACCRYWKIGQLLGIANTTSILVISSDFALNPLRTVISTSNFKLYTTKANAIAEVAQQALTTPGVGDTNITQSSYIVNELNGVIGLQLSGTPLTPGRAYSGYYVINQEL